ncbi:MAG TPA: MlaD family protein [Dysgonamonadaceae bacterium]|jgi:phospholipid/cholesterol/gamma-HCH transport system substrate-binding protein|nr:MlaD family protein [Dysgonamonadaceae bacterium]
MKNNLRKNVIIGLAFLASLMMLYFGVNFLKGFNVLKKQNNYVAVFDDVTGLVVSSPIYLNGYQVGLVNSIKMISTDPVKIAVEIGLEENFKLKSGSYLEYDIELLGGSACKLLMDNESTTYLNVGDTIRGTKSQGLMDGVAQIMPKADSILAHVDSVVLALNSIMKDPAMQQSLTNMQQTVVSLNAATSKLNMMLGALQTDLPQISGNLNTVSSNLKDVTNDINSLDINKTFQSIDQTVANLELLTSKLNSPDNSVGKLLNTPEFHDSLNVTIQSVTNLLNDIRKDPKKYLDVRVRLF